MAAISLPQAHSPQSQVLAFMLGLDSACTNTGRAKDPVFSKTGLSAVRLQQEDGERRAAEAARASPEPAECPAEWTRSGRLGRGEVRSDLEEGQQRAQIREGGAGAARSGCEEALGRQGEESHRHYMG